MSDAVNLLTGLGPNALLATIVVILWRKLEKSEEQRFADLREATTRMLALTERVHELIDKLPEPDDPRRSRHD